MATTLNGSGFSTSPGLSGTGTGPVAGPTAPTLSGTQFSTTNNAGASAAGLGATAAAAVSSASAGKIQWTGGWYVTVACSVGILLAGTPAAPFVLGLLGLALIYQLGLLLQGK